MMTVEGRPLTVDAAAKAKKFGSWLREQTTARSILTGKPRYMLAKEAGMDWSTWKNYQNGGRTNQGHWNVTPPSIQSLLAMAKVLDIAPAEMFRRAGMEMPAGLKGVPRQSPPSELQQLLSVLDKVSEDERQPIVDTLAALVRQVADLDERLRRQSGR